MQPELQLLNNFEADNKWLNANYEKIQQEHPNEFVAVSRGIIVGSGKSVEKIVHEMNAKGIDASSALIEFVPEKGLKIII